ncbi:MAG TPA: RNA-binding S4 domain-containing protein [Daejeonella sp.]|nr:RNA-binding S4 domain-containing protein [Daejeonella sp.]
MSEVEKLRIDKYLWAIRAFKTRSVAAEACKAGRVKWDGQNLKPSHVVKVGETYTVQKGIERKVIKVIALLERRVDAKTAVDFYEDLTPVENTHAYRSMFHAPALKRDPGAGRPTKKDRREIDDLQDGWFDD